GEETVGTALLSLKAEDSLVNSFAAERDGIDANRQLSVELEFAFGNVNDRARLCRNEHLLKMLAESWAGNEAFVLLSARNEYDEGDSRQKDAFHDPVFYHRLFSE